MCLCIYNFSVDTQRPSCFFEKKGLEKFRNSFFFSKEFKLIWDEEIFLVFFSADGTK